MNKCCFKNIDKAIRKGRAKYICPKCKQDVSLLWFLYAIMVFVEIKPIYWMKYYGQILVIPNWFCTRFKDEIIINEETKEVIIKFHTHSTHNEVKDENKNIID